MRLDVYGFSERAYRTLTGYPDWQTIFKLAADARRRRADRARVTGSGNNAVRG